MIKTSNPTPVGRDRPIANFLDLLSDRARDTPDLAVAVFADFDGRIAKRTELTYGELLGRARAVAAILHFEDSQAPVAILCPKGPEFLVGLVACLLGGRLGIPLYPPEPDRPDLRLTTAITDAGADTVLTTAGCRPEVGRLLGSLKPRSWNVHDIDSIDGTERTEFPVPRPAPADIAYLQYTSGSTRLPAGVAVTHHNLMAATVQLARCIDLTSESRLVTWLPFFHDMGLIFALTAARVGATAHYLSPRQFVEDPYRWLWLLSVARGTHSVTPNFGLEMCVTRVPEADRAELDLSALRVLVNGAEPIRKPVLDKFSETYTPHGFDPAAHLPGYGLAEATLTVACAPHGAGAQARWFDRTALRAGRAVDAPPGHSEAVQLVGCGTAVDQQVRIVDPRTRTALPAGRVGEIWTRGDNVCAGYWQQPEVSAELFDAELLHADGTASRGWLRTEDLGVVVDEHIYIVARLRDIVIVDGQNHYPADLEATLAQTIPTVTQTAAFGVVVDGRERLVLAMELRRGSAPTADVHALRRTVRRTIGEQHGLAVHDVLFVRNGGIPRTTSGKVQRSRCSRLYEEGGFDLLPQVGESR